MNIQQYVSERLTGETEYFLQEIVDHGIYNTGANIIDGCDELEHQVLDAEFRKQAAQLLKEI